MNRKMKVVQVKFKATLLLMVTLFFFSVGYSNTTSNLKTNKASTSLVQDELLDKLNAKYEGYTYKINRRKKLVVKKITAINTVYENGFKIIITADVKLERKFRRDGNGHVDIIADLRFNGNEACLSNSKLKTLKLSRTFRVLEHIFKFFAGKIIKDNTCFKFM